MFETVYNRHLCMVTVTPVSVVVDFILLSQVSFSSLLYLYSIVFHITYPAPPLIWVCKPGNDGYFLYLHQRGGGNGDDRIIYRCEYPLMVRKRKFSQNFSVYLLQELKCGFQIIEDGGQ